MKAVILRCTGAHVSVDGRIVGRIGQGLTVFLGVMEGDDEIRASRLAQKISTLRIFSDADGKFNDSLRDVGGSVLVIPNFTICGDARKGNRPSFSMAAPPASARALYERFATLLRENSVPVETGVFSADMKVHVENDGPVTIILEVI
jgi:D-tyrosyl-tRNA(Tyr) deacylase